MPYFLNEQRRLVESIRELESIIARREPEEGADRSERLLTLSHLLSQKHVALADHIALCERLEVELPLLETVRQDLERTPLANFTDIWKQKPPLGL
ncbi:hypothetical protein [Thioclava sp. GXIMD2076]|uniref:hypothetical protein n=1 Tax=unclassified Thioclava TaxID=2621713 RepID=UPI0030D40BC4